MTFNKYLTFLFITINLFNISLAEPYINKELTGQNLNFEYKFNLNSSLITGNVERNIFLTKGEISIFNPKIGFSSINNYQFGTIGKNITENDILSRNFIYLFPENTIYPYIMAWLEKNQRRQIDYRYQIGLGGSWVFFNNENHKAKVSLTFTNEQSDFASNKFVNFDNKSSEIINTWRFALRFAGRNQLISEKLKLNYEIWLQPSFINIDNFRYHIESGLEFPLSKNLSFLTSFNYNYESIVITNVKQSDFMAVFGLSIGNF